MNCQQIDKYIYEFCDNQLAPQMHDGIQAHLDQCENCRDKVAAVRREGNWLRSWETIPALQSDFTSQVMSLIQEKSKRRPRGFLTAHASRHSHQMRWWWGVASAAVLILALCSMPLLEQPIGIRLAEQNDQSGFQTETLPAALNNIPEISPEPESQPAAEPVKEPVKESAQESPVQVDRVAMKDAQTVASPKDTSLAEDSLPSPGLRSFSSATPSDQMIKSPNLSNPNRGVELMTLHPANLPPQYSLQAVISNSERDITFVYKNQTTLEELSLRLTAVDSPSNGADMAGSSEEPLLKSASPTTAEGSGGASPPDTVLSNSFQSKMDYNQQHYQLVISGNLDTEELTVIANSIKLEEGVQFEKTVNP